MQTVLNQFNNDYWLSDHCFCCHFLHLHFIKTTWTCKVKKTSQDALRVGFPYLRSGKRNLGWLYEESTCDKFPFLTMEVNWALTHRAVLWIWTCSGCVSCELASADQTRTIYIIINYSCLLNFNLFFKARALSFCVLIC